MNGRVKDGKRGCGEWKGRGEEGRKGFHLQLGILDPAVEEGRKGEGQGGELGLEHPCTSFSRTVLASKQQNF